MNTQVKALVVAIEMPNEERLIMRKPFQAFCLAVTLAVALLALDAVAALASFQLPDGRGYELVTPADKGDGILPATSPGGLQNFGGLQASISGDGIGYPTFIPLPGSQAGGQGFYLASRGAAGWSSQSLIPPQASTTYVEESPRIAAYSLDLSKATLVNGGPLTGDSFGQDDPSLVPGEPPRNQNLFLRDNSNASYQLMDVTPPGAIPSKTEFEGASADLSHVIFNSSSKLTPDAIDFTGGTPSGVGSLYQWFGGTVSLIGLIPPAGATSCGGGGAACVASPLGASVGAGASGGGGAGGGFDGGHGRFLNGVSPDGSKVFFIEGAGFDPFQLYMRENGTTTVEVSASRKTNGAGPGGTDPNGPLRPEYWPASRDGSRAFFTSCEQLTDDSTAEAINIGGSRNCGGGRDLYQYDTASGALSDLSVDHNGDPQGADVQGVLGSSVDGSFVYFVANGVLAPGASLGDCRVEVRPVGQCSLYLYHAGVTTFIARLDSSSDSHDWNSFTARVTPDGTRLAFDSVRSLTGYDNTVAGGGPCGHNGDGQPLPPECLEVFLYDAVANQLRCVSCNPSGARPIGPSSIDPVEPGDNGGSLSSHLSRNLSDDGSRLFFDSSDALVPGDINGKQDVYEYADGQPRLISSGTSNELSAFLDASAGGSDVFFDTSAQLVGQDSDREFDIYDARVGGGFPFTPAPLPCAGESCKPPAASQPADQLPGSGSVFGAGNLMPAPAVSGVKGRSLTRAQRLAGALRACKRKPRRRRASCVAHAHRLYGPARVAGKATRRSGRGTK